MPCAGLTLIRINSASRFPFADMWFAPRANGAY
jgi:hypothetical protein